MSSILFSSLIIIVHTYYSPSYTDEE